MRVVFRLPPADSFDYFLTWRGGARLWLPRLAPELALLKPELRFEIYEGLRLGGTELERVAAVSPRQWRELYSAAAFVDYGEPPEPPATMWYADPDLAVVSAAHLAARGFRVLLELPALMEAQAAVLAGLENVTVCVAVSSRGLEAATMIENSPRPSARAVLRAINMLGGSWDERSSPALEDAGGYHAAFESYTSRVQALEPPQPRELKVGELLAWAFGKERFREAAEVLGEVVAGPLPLRSLPDLSSYHDTLRKLLLYGYVAAERDVLRATEKGVFAALQTPHIALPGGRGGGAEEERV